MKKAIIFDMDGVISDTQKFHATAEHTLLKKFGIEMDPEVITRKYAGISDEQMFREIFYKNRVVVNDIKDVIFDKWNIMGKLSRGKITAMPHALTCISLVKRGGLKLAIASASTRDFITHVLDSLHIKDTFDVVVSAQEVEYGKPAPDIFLLAASRLELEPKECIVIEDGLSGVVAARKAGMKSVGLVTNQNNSLPADLVVSSLNQITLDKIRML
ncbi:HAD family phosphatase [Candidatus Roizmanbacteria bacterium]|nr:HAD family phosphatase [Candidatus Roizmanbacteria bacterium]